MATSLISIIVFAASVAAILDGDRQEIGWSVALTVLVSFGSSAVNFREVQDWIEYATLSFVGSLAVLIVGGLAAIVLGGAHFVGVYFAVGGAASFLHLTSLLRLRVGTVEAELTAALAEPTTATATDARPVPNRGITRIRALAVDSRTLLSCGVGVAICLVAANGARGREPGLWGLLGVVPPYWFLGLGLICAGLLIGRPRSELDAATGILALTIALVGTPALAYSVPLYPWTEKQVGLVDYILRYGSVHRSSQDIYQSWPGFFSAMALFSKATEIPALTLARWWPLLTDIVGVLAVRCLALRLRLGVSPRQAWIAAGLFLGANALGQDYFSPQAAAYLLALGIYILAVGNELETARARAYRIGLIAALSIVLAGTHQISPLFVTLSLLVLGLFRIVKPRWLFVVAALPAVVWDLANLSLIRHYLHGDQFGHLGSNIATPSSQVSGAHKDFVLHLSSGALAGGALIVGVLALVGLGQARNRLKWAITLTALSSAFLLVVSSYGGEGLYRCVLFALPWLAILACTLRPRWPRIVALAAVPVLACTYLLANSVLNSIMVVTPAQISADSVFEQSAPDGSYLVAVGGISSSHSLSARYLDFHYEEFPIVPQGGAAFTAFARRQARALGVPATYAVASESELYEGTLEGLYTPRQYRSFESYLAASPSWHVIYRAGTVRLYRLRA